MPEKENPLEIIDINDVFLSGQTGAFSSKTTEKERKQIVERINGFTVSDEKRRFVDMYIFTGGDTAGAYKSVFDKDDTISNYQAKKKGEALLSKDKDVIAYSDFIREQAISAMGYSDKADEYMNVIVHELASQIRGDIYDYTDFSGGSFTIKDPATLTTEQRRRVKRMKVTEMQLKDGTKKTTIDIELWNKEKMIDMFIKHLKGYTSRSFGTTTSERVDQILDNAEKTIETEYYGDVEDADYEEIS